jgi:hypothetical protein
LKKFRGRQLQAVIIAAGLALVGWTGYVRVASRISICGARAKYHAELEQDFKRESEAWITMAKLNEDTMNQTKLMLGEEGLTNSKVFKEMANQTVVANRRAATYLQYSETHTAMVKLYRHIQYTPWVIMPKDPAFPEK